MSITNAVDLPTDKPALEAEYERLSAASWVKVAPWEKVPETKIRHAEATMRRFFADIGVPPVKLLDASVFVRDWMDRGEPEEVGAPNDTMKWMYEAWVRAHAVAYKDVTGKVWPGSGIDLYLQVDRARRDAVKDALFRLKHPEKAAEMDASEPTHAASSDYGPPVDDPRYDARNSPAFRTAYEDLAGSKLSHETWVRAEIDRATAEQTEIANDMLRHSFERVSLVETVRGALAWMSWRLAGEPAASKPTDREYEAAMAWVAAHSAAYEVATGREYLGEGIVLHLENGPVQKPARRLLN